MLFRLGDLLLQLLDSVRIIAENCAVVGCGFAFAFVIFDFSPLLNSLPQLVPASAVSLGRH